MVPTLSLFFIAFNMVMGVVIPFGLFVYLRKNYHTARRSFIVGCMIMLVFALIFEQMVHGVVFQSPIGGTIRGNIWLYALYGGIMAGLFEETGRFIGIKLILKKDMDNPYNAFMYGAGHGGLEVFVILVIGNINNLVLSLLNNRGQAEGLLAPLDESVRPQLQSTFTRLITTPSWHFLLSSIERIGAITAQIALSVLIWFVVRGGRKCVHLYVLAIFLHFFMDASTAVLSYMGFSTILIEVYIWILAAIYVFIAVKIWKKYKLIFYGKDNIRSI